MAEEDVKLNELLDVIVARLKDSVQDLEAALRCIQTYKADPKDVQACIIDYMKTGEPPFSKVKL